MIEASKNAGLIMKKNCSKRQKKPHLKKIEPMTNMENNKHVLIPTMKMFRDPRAVLLHDIHLSNSWLDLDL